ncbi:DUF6931 family protein [Flexibacterium corallicola]|uniref:DUF6931 family protein n=1 Tax=Flexibacterium corallicola TaxID=3037259 RepID=UPI00286FAA9F|nr:hypothetical protein [Pseudovibrio sp. M1P-2-3]
MLKKIPFTGTKEILARFALSAEAKPLLQPRFSPLEAMERLIEASLLTDYVNFVAHALPPREGICWALAIQHDYFLKDTQEAPQIREAVRSWVHSPSEDKRRQILAKAEEVGTSVPTGWLCYAVGWNGSGSIADPKGPVVLPPPYLHAKALLGAVALIPINSEGEIQSLLKTAHKATLQVANGDWPTVF